ncbi:ADP-ribose pyrophosphatase YjhB, NUDIX family [Amycolatopsis pretoriensis]|uniref:ADP-ribose pyrophosphatase YjhB, NUDIX family n=1 Tax=Amycolatopsis pretoriensis TaxID=218821 RepID=A0A1H5R6Z1_9PSEU|nr:NUDIX domain-containing protein [Amycolatopsis pretoriensis]SEF33824.1 ADP-ribose pyrophosphatase YjhB, NUDIX family [Amycolatopsis pretoriensis]
MPMARPTVQPLVFGLVEYDGKLLVHEERDDVSGRTVWRPPGGTIAFGERAENALRRQVPASLGRLAGVKAFGALENHPVVDGRPGHQIVLLYEATLADPNCYGAADLDGARWHPVLDFVEGREMLAPEGLADLLDWEP